MIIALVIIAGSLLVIKSQINKSAKEKEIEAAKVAHWIWDSKKAKGEADEANVWMNFRKVVTIDKVPREAIAKIAAESRYWLYVNGENVVFEGGLKRGPNRTDGYYDEVDLAPHLQEGENTIAVAVWNWGDVQEQSFSSTPVSAAGFLWEGYIGESKIVSDESWKVKRDLAYLQSDEYEIEDQPNYRLIESNIYYDARNEIGAWQMPEYDDESWQSATIRGRVPDAPWGDLHERSIPLLKDYGLREYVNSSEYNNYTTTKEEVLAMKLEYNAQITPYLEIEAPAGLKIDMWTDNYDFGDDGKSVKSAYITKEGHQNFEALGWFNGEYVYYRIPAGITVMNLQFRETGYDTEFAGSFTSDSEFFNELWTKSQRTLYITMRDNYMDCPDRERAQWWGDVTSEMVMAMYALDEKSYQLYEKGLTSKLGYIEEDVLFTVVPNKNYNTELPVQELAGIRGYWDYYLYTGKTEILEELYEPSRRYLELWELQEDGLVEHRTGTWDWMDWGRRADKVAIVNAWYYYAMATTREMAVVLGKEADIPKYDKKLSTIKQAYQELWTEEGFKSEEQEAPDDRANAVAVIAGLAEPEQYETILEVLFHTYNSSPYMERYVYDAMVEMGYLDHAFVRMINRYKEMVEGEDEYSTLWEHWESGKGTKNHAWTGGPLITMSRDITGIMPLTAGYETYQIKPNLGPVNEVSVVVPAIIGDIEVEIRSSEDRRTFNMNVKAPGKNKATVAIPRVGEENVKVTANGKTIFVNGNEKKRLFGPNYSGIDERYLYFEIEGGEWEFEATVVE